MNIREFTSKRIELEAVIQINSRKPDLVALNETFLNRSIEKISLTGYEVVSRRDRTDQSGFGGIALFARQNIAPFVTLLEHSEENERSWHVIHSDIGPILLGIWYRPPQNGEIQSIRRLEAK